MVLHSTFGGWFATAAVAALSLSLPASAIAQLSAQVVAPSEDQLQPASPDAVSNNVLSLEKVSRRNGPISLLKELAKAHGHGSTHIDDLEDYEFIATIAWDGIPVKVSIDTGSSDTWLVQSGFQCLDVTGKRVPETTCQFGPPYKGNFKKGALPNLNFNISYGDGEFLSGDFGLVDVKVAGITARQQQVALVKRAYWTGDLVTSGLLGLAYPLLTSAFTGNDPTKDSPATQVVYDSIFTTMVKEKVVNPVFSLACERNSSGGYLALGGLPPAVRTGPLFAKTPIRKLEVVKDPAMLTHYSFYTIVADAYVYQGSNHWSGIDGSSSGSSWWTSLFNWPQINRTQFPIVVDSGSTLMLLPTDMTNAIVKLFDPPAVFVADQGSYYAPCNAKVPEVSVVIGGVSFGISAADLLVQEQPQPDGTCLVGISDGGQGPFVLGNTFLNNVLAVFDVGASEMRFSHHYY